MIKAKLFVFGTERELLDTDLEYYRVLNSKTGRCGQIPMGGFVTLSFGSTYNDDVLLRWITNAPEGELCTLTACKIVFYEDDLDGIALFEYKYNDAALVCWKEAFNSVGTHLMMITITISAAIQEVKGITWVKTWQESWIPPSEKMPYQSQEIEKKPRIIDAYYTDINSKEIPENKLKRGQTVYFVIKTINATGKELAIDLDNNKLDFIYKNEVLEDDILRVNISSDTMVLELKTIVEKN